MMAKKDRFPPGYCSSGAPQSEGSGSSGCNDSVDGASASKRKWVDLNSASRDGFSVPIQIIPLSKLSSFERKDLVLRLTLELEKIRLLQSKVESQKKTTVNKFPKSNSNDILTYNGQQKGSMVGNLNKSALMNSASGKKARGWNRGITGRFQSANNNSHVNAINATLKQCEGLLKKLMSQQYAWVFNSPVDVVKLNIPDYFSIIKTPMDLGTVKSKLSSGKYANPLEFLADVRLTFTNAKTYNPPGSDVHVLAESFSQIFETRWKAIEKKFVVTTSHSVPKKLGGNEETGIPKTLAPSKKRKLSPRQHEVKQEPTKRKMTDEDRHKLSMELESSDGDLPDAVIEFLKAHIPNRGDDGEDEIEIVIDDLSDDTLFTLRRLLDEHLPDNQKNLARSEACEIELPNVSGLSNSSLHVDKGNDNDPIDEDVDIGGNEAPVTSYLPVLIEKDVGGRAEEYNEAGPDSYRGSECSKGFSAVKLEQDETCQAADSANKKGDQAGEHLSASEFDHLDDGSVKPSSSESDGHVDVEGAQDDRQVSPDKLYRAAILKNRFLDTILKAREKTLTQDEKMDPEKLRREREELEMHRKREKARLQAEAKAAEDARKRAEAEAAAEEKRRRDLKREEAREALLKMEKTVEINENSRFLEDLEMLRTAPPEQLVLATSVDDASPEESQDGFGSFKFGNNPLEQLGLYMKMDEDDDEPEPQTADPNATTQDVEEGEID
ncbi:transcription factor GTE9-like [Salvia splendens]|uniref:transcription factor GTE9-like n=1 Tax=Salvia splendens TaxID=180675 RepID=UPI001C25B2EB|nr:transcription factor GTE9-like [Salvia splendens]XP_042061303.1 transcription factor GTE9-like [Salvia splendens]